MEWQLFWEQFDDSIHSKPQLSDPIKLAYLQQTLKDGIARHTNEGLSGTTSNYREAITVLPEHYNRPRLLHQAHMHAIVEAPSLKDGSGKELHRLRNVLAQHLHVLNVINYKPGLFVTSLIELILDQATSFEWHRHIQGTLKVPHHSELIKFLDLRAQAAESATCKGIKR